MDLSQTPDRGHRRRLVLFVGGAILVAVALTGVVYFKDEPLEDHRDLAPDPARVKGGDATYEAWLSAAAMLDLPAAESRMSEAHGIASGYQPWDPTVAESVLDPNRAALDAAIQADALGAFIVPLVTGFPPSEEEGEREGALMDFDAFNPLSTVLALRTLEQVEAGDLTSARDTALVLLRFGDRLAEGNGSLLSYSLGTYVRRRAFSVIEKIADAGASDLLLADLPRPLEEGADSVESYRRAVRAEFVTIPDLATRLNEPGNDLWFACCDVPPSFLFTPNRSVNIAAALYRRALADADRLPAARHGPEPDNPTPGLARFGVNAYGEYVMAFMTSTLWRVLNSTDANTSQRRLLRVKLALLRFERAEGKLPATLAELVPAYLDAVPADPFDGNPLRYDPARGLVWVLGSNLTDEGAATEPENGFSSHDDDPALLLHPQPTTAP